VRPSRHLTSSALRVLHVVPTLARDYGGPSVAIVGMAGALARAGLDVTVLATLADGERPVDGAAGLAGAGVRVVALDRPRMPLVPDGFALSPRLGRWLERNVARFDLVHVHTVFTHPSSLGCRHARLADVPYVLRPCGMLDPWSLAQGWLKKLLSRRIVDRRNLAGASAFHFTSDEERAGAWAALRARSVVIPLGVDGVTGRPSGGDGPGERTRQILARVGGRKVILFLSRLHEKKGLDLLIPALGGLARRRDDFVLVLAGSGSADYARRVHRMLGEHALTDMTELAGFVGGDDKAALLRAADLFVLPSYQENFGISVVEAMAAGLPVVVSDRVNIERTVAEQRAGLVVPCRVDELAGAIERLLDGDAMRRRMGAAGRRLAEAAFTWDAVSPRLIGLYEDLLAASGRGSAPGLPPSRPTPSIEARPLTPLLQEDRT